MSDRNDLGRVTGSCPAGQAPTGLDASRCDPARIVAAFSNDWERLGLPAQRLNLSHGNRLIAQANKLHAQGLVERRFSRGNFEWRRA